MNAVSDPGTAGGQWTAVIVTLVLVICIVVSVSLTYFLYATNRMALTILDDCHKQFCKSQASRQRRYIAMSVSEITQLSTEADNLCVISSPPVIIHQLVKRRSKAKRKISLSVLSVPCFSQEHTSGEVMLLPERLLTDNRGSAPYTASLSETEFYSSHSLPSDCDCHKLAPGLIQQSETFASSFELNESHNDNPGIHTWKVQKRRKNLHRPLAYSSYMTLAEARKVVRRCKKAGISLIQRSVQLWHRSSHRWSTRNSFVKFRHSVNTVRTARERALAAYYSAEMYKSTYGCYPTTASDMCSEP
ncbi:hypothetical protein BsWGS_15522 [Bradybaena similaris]